MRQLQQRRFSRMPRALALGALLVAGVVTAAIAGYSQSNNNQTLLGIPFTHDAYGTSLAQASTATPTPVGGIYGPIWSSVDGGGGTFSTGGNFTMSGTMGQPDAGSMTDGSYTINGGFWGVAAPAATATPTNTPSATATMTPILVGHVNWQGGGAQPNARQQQPVTLTLKLGTTEVNYPSQNTDASGFFTVSVGSLPNGTYNWRAKGPKFLATSGTVTLAGAEQTNRQMGVQPAGDANDNNIVNAVDFSLLRAAFGTTNDPRTDFNNDGITNSVDFNLLRGNFGIAGDPPIGPREP
jgi:hypothetical protein